jgi:hypothetical protein
MTEKNKKNSTEPELIIDRAEESIARAAEGLIFISETDAAIELFRWEEANEVTVDAVRNMAEIADDSPVEEADVDDFFSKLTVKKEWFGDRETERAERFADLYTELRANLRDLRVFRFGRIQISIYIVGVDAEGNLAGVMTKAVET